MKFGYFCNTTNWIKKPYAELLDEVRDISVYCDKNKWNSIIREYFTITRTSSPIYTVANFKCAKNE